MPLFSVAQNVIGQINIIMIIWLYLIWESFAGNDCLKSGTHDHQQRLGYLICDALPGLYGSWLQLLFVGLSAFSFVFSTWNAAQSSWDHSRIFHFYLQKLLGCFCCMFWVISTCTMKCRPNQLCWIWLNLGREYMPVHRADPPYTQNTQAA